MAEIVNEVRLGTSKMFEHLKISCADFLDEMTGRSVCPKCGKSRKYFCYTCYVAMDEIADRIPNVKLPLKVDIIKHPREVDGKSTAVHAAVLAPNDVSIYTYPYIPTYDPKDKVLMIFPGKNSTSLAHLLKKLNTDSACFESSCNGTSVNAAFACMCTFKHKLDESDLTLTSCTPLTDCVRLCISDHCCKCFNMLDESEPNEEVSRCSACCKAFSSTLDDKKDVDTSDFINGAIKRKCEMNKRLLKSRFPFERVILIDSTWNQVRGIRKDERLQDA